MKKDIINYLDQFDTENQTIVCPECERVQEAEIILSEPYSTFIHVCEKCSYIITESEWVTAEEEEFKEQTISMMDVIMFFGGIAVLLYILYAAFV